MNGGGTLIMLMFVVMMMMPMSKIGMMMSELTEIKNE